VSSNHHLNMASTVSPPRNPSPQAIRAAREQAGLTQTQAGALVHTTCRTWQQWEAEPGTKDHRAMHPAFWELFQGKIAGLPLLEGIAMTTTKAQRRLAHEQALASTRIEGHQPSPEFLADCEAVIEGTMTRDQARAASLARALAKDKAATAATAAPIADAA
jgi:DNA-binding XRE family transcriptional regulator